MMLTRGTEYVAVDFDGTVVTHNWPDIGRDVGAVPFLRMLSSKGVKIILNTARDGHLLEDAVGWFRRNRIPLFGVNCNPDHPSIGNSKPYANIYIDDYGINCPLKLDPFLSDRPFVDWDAVAEIMSKEGWL